MTTLSVKDESGAVLADCVRVADSFTSRLRGLLGVKSINFSEGLMLDSCRSIHTVGMSVPIDVVFLDKANRITRICHEVKPGRVRLSPSGTVKTLELAAGAARDQNIKLYEKLSLEPGK